MHNIYQVCHLSCNPRSCERCSSCQVHTLWRPRCHLLGGITSKAGNIWLAEKVQYRAFSGIACRFFKNGCGVNNERIDGIGRCSNAFGLGWAVLLCFIGSCHYENDVVFVVAVDPASRLLARLCFRGIPDMIRDLDSILETRVTIHLIARIF